MAQEAQTKIETQTSRSGTADKTYKSNTSRGKERERDLETEAKRRNIDSAREGEKGRVSQKQRHRSKE